MYSRLIKKKFVNNLNSEHIPGREIAKVDAKTIQERTFREQSKQAFNVNKRVET